jgi:hypothetical protein
MAHFVGLDVSVKETSVRVVDDAGKVILEQNVPTEPADLIALLTSLGVSYGRIGIEAGPLSQWLVNALTAAELLDLECELRGTLRNFGLKVGIVSGGRYEARVRELVSGFPRLAAIAEPLLNVRRVMRQQLAVLHKMLLDTVRGDPVCRRLMTLRGSARWLR